MPEHVFVYQLRDTSGEVLYVGATRDLKARLARHRRTKPWWHEVDTEQTTATEYATAWDGSEAERALISALNPRHNRAGVDGSMIGHIPYPAVRPAGLIPRRIVAVLEAQNRQREVAAEQEACHARLKAAVLHAAANGSSVRKLAAFTGLSTNTISRWKRGE